MAYFNKFCERVIAEVIGDNYEMVTILNLGATLFWTLTPLIFMIFLSILKRKVYIFVLSLSTLIVAGTSIWVSNNWAPSNIDQLHVSSPPSSPLDYDDSSKDTTNNFSIMSFNMRGAGLDIGTNSWENRRDNIVEMLHKQQPMIVATQEASGNMLPYISLKTGLNMVHNSWSGSLYDSNRIELIEFEKYELFNPNEENVDSSKRRSKTSTYCLYKFLTKKQKTKENDEENQYLIHFNVHLDYIDENRRLSQINMLQKKMKLIISKLSQTKYQKQEMIFNPSSFVISITGDFNTLRKGHVWENLMNGFNKRIFTIDPNSTSYDSNSYADVIEKTKSFSIKLYDTYQISSKYENKTFFTFHGYLNQYIESLYYTIPINIAMIMISNLFPLNPLCGLRPFSSLKSNDDFHIDWIIFGEINLLYNTPSFYDQISFKDDVNEENKNDENENIFDDEFAMVTIDTLKVKKTFVELSHKDDEKDKIMNKQHQQSMRNVSVNTFRTVLSSNHQVLSDHHPIMVEFSFK